MARRFQTPTRTISNRGEHPRFTGLMPSPKTSARPAWWPEHQTWGVLPYDSISAMVCARYLEWRSDVASIAFEARWHQFDANGSLAALRCNPDFEVVLTTGELEWVEAKHSRSALRPAEKTRLELAQQHFAAAGLTYTVIYREDLEADGFADTLLLLRQYGLWECTEAVLVSAQNRLSNFQAGDLRTWRARAVDAKVAIAVLYKLLYLQRLPLNYLPLQFVELHKWQN